MMDVCLKRGVFAFFLGSLLMSVASWGAGPGAADPDADYDRLDGTGASGKKVNVIEWEGNLEIHVYPAGSLKGLALKLDKKNKDKPVMVIGYRFDNDPGKQLIRRAILGIDLHEGFKAYRDSADDYDKIVISNNGLSLAQFKLDPAPKQMYPEGYPAGAKSQKAVADGAAPDDGETREPAGANPMLNKTQLDQATEDREMMQDSGTIRPFLGHPKANH